MEGWTFDVDPRFLVDVRRRGPVFYSVRVTDTATGQLVPVAGGDLLTGRGSVRRAVHYSTARYLGRSESLVTVRLGGHRAAGQPPHPVAAPAGPPPATVRLVVVLARLYAVGLVVLAAVLLYRAVTGSGFVAAKQLDGRALGGVVGFGIVLLGAAGLLALGAREARAGRAVTALVVPLVPVVGFGVIGEIADSLGSATVTSDIIGVGIILAAALPLALLATRAARRFRSSGTAPG